MVTTIHAVFDGTVFRPESPPGLAPNTRVRITIEPVRARAVEPLSFLRVARSLRVDGPPDWATNLEHCLYDVDEDHGE